QKEKMKKVIVLLTLAMVLCLVLASCGDSGSNSGTTTTAAKPETTGAAQTTTTAAKQAETETSAAVSESEPEITESEPEPSESETEPSESETEPETSESGAEGVSLFDAAPQELKDVEDFKAIVNGKYSIKYEMEEMGQKATAEIYADGDRYSTVMKMGEYSMKMTSKDGKAYYIFDSAKKYFEADASEMMTSPFKTSEGVNVSYEGVSDAEFEGKAVKVYSFKNESDGVTSDMQFYVDGDDIVAIGGEGQVAAMEISDDVSGMVEIPSDYEAATEEEAMSLLMGGLMG
ncbi:MAG: hypothetical protein IJS94_02045, partial [Clostridia bacterium]|nr:hypothetical protein [Clostridia bacterium]